MSSTVLPPCPPPAPASLIDVARLDEVALDAGDRERFARHLILPHVGADGQRRLKAARVLCVGTGGLGSPAALYLAAAGVGTLGLVDPDRVERSNLQRQVLFSERDVGRPKLEAADERLRALYPDLDVRCFPVRFAADNALAIARDFDIILDGTDNFATRYLSNDISVFLGKPNVYGSIFRFEGQVSVFAPSRGGPCYRCMFPTPPDPGMVPSCAEGGVLGVLPGLVGTLQATECLKLLLGIGEPLVGRLLHVDTLTMQFRTFRLRRDPQCPVCSPNPTITAPVDYDAFCGGSGTGPGQGPGSDAPAISVTELASRLAQGLPPDAHVLDVRTHGEWEIAHLPGARLVPLDTLPAEIGALDPAHTYYVHCKAGTRSAKAAAFLREAGFRSVVDVPGGIDAWAAEIDDRMPRY